MRIIRFLTMGILFATCGVFNQAFAKSEKLSGKVSVFIEDLKNHQSRTRAFMKDAAGKTVELKFSAKDQEKLHGLKSGQLINVDGNRKSSDANEVEVAYIQSQQSGAGSTSGGPVFTGVRKVLFVVLNFNDGGSSVDLSALQTKVLGPKGSLQSMYKEASNGAISFTSDNDGNGQVDVQSVKLNVNGAGTCNYTNWADLADAQLGSKISNYNHVLYVIPFYLSSCEFGGVANYACAATGGCRAWVVDMHLHATYIGHELGHNLGFHHAAFDEENDLASIEDYLDYSDMMSNDTTAKKFNAPHMLYAGWVSQTTVTNLAVDQTGTFSIASPGNFSSSLPKMIKIPRSFPDNTKDYYISYRDATGEDSTLTAKYAKKISIHYVSRSGGAYTILAGTIGVGQVFVDLDQQLGVRFLAEDGKSAQVEVFKATVNDPVCYSSKLGISYKSQRYYVTTTGASQLVATIKNKDSYACATRTSNFEVNGNPALNKSYQSSGVSTMTLTLAPQESRDVVVNYSLNGTAFPTYGMKVFMNARDSVTSISVLPLQNGTYVYIDNTPPVMGVLTSDSGQRTLSYYASDNNFTINGYEIYRNCGSGFVKIADTTLTSYVDSSLQPGVSCSYYVVAIDGAGLKSSPSNTVSMGGMASLQAPTLDSAVLKRTGIIAVSWTAPSQSVSIAGYYLKRYLPDGSLWGEVAVSGTRYTDKSFPANTVITYKVYYKTTDGNVSPESNGISVLTSK